MAAEKPIRVLLAERNPLVVSALKHLIGKDERFAFTGTAESGAEIIRRSDDPDFDIVVVGWTLADMDGASLLIKLKEKEKPPRVVIFSAEEDIVILRQAVRLGTYGFCYQFDDPEVLFDTLLAVANGRICIPYLDLTLVNDTAISKLTVRERELLSMLALGWTNVQIAARTGISQNTVKYYLKNLYEKLDVQNRAMAVAVWLNEQR
ncbi:nitrate/nitrite regulatory protein [Fulvimarina pelagi HTCC2506]|uniref:Nitrate/nitrite regulatory protein n=1 Tax=Fulvimarina pelagi HTCC2506 TaxID=314231 RepID=Q0G2B3_9HYPH|nr:response regulator transcription factor [Fulvimarina pelagi]EAU41285.1 nitrate/nitrite regulatory protein [Fulvimarina pelagi HTCC2506]